MFLCKKLVGLLFCSFFLLICKAQQNQIPPNAFAKYTDFLPPAPEAAAIAKAGLLRLSGNTGAPNIELPLISAKGSKSKLDISLNYTTDGIRVDELSSRVGMGWTLNAGGVVSRTVRGWPDENHTRLGPWETFGSGWGTYEFCNRVIKSTNVSGFDSEPDFFTYNFNGVSGGFYLDADMNPVLVPFTNVKIKVNSLSVNVSDNMIITAPDGVRYYFGGGPATETTKRTTDCGRDFSQPVPTSWNLTKIEYPNGEIIEFQYSANEFTYDLGIDQYYCQTGLTTSVSSVECGLTYEEPLQGNSSLMGCKNSQQSKVSLLQKISVNKNCSVEFAYRSRPDCDDNLLESITYKNTLNESSIELKKIIFNYAFENYSSGVNNGFLNSDAVLAATPYLVKIDEYGNGDLNSTPMSHRFSYIDPVGRCPRLSFSQDHWGYFNGKSNTNLIPPPKAQLIHPMPLATADRDADFRYSQKGMLNKIIYPTGGIEMIEYEPNTFNTQKQIGPKTQYECSVTGISNYPTDIITETTKEVTFSFDTQQDVFVTLILDCTNCPQADHELGSVTIKNSLDQSMNGIQTGSDGNNILTFYQLPAGTYKLIMMAKPQGVTTAILNYKPKIETVEYNEQSGGVRVKQVFKGNKNETPIVTRYFYGDLNNLEKSSNINHPIPEYEESFAVTSDLFDMFNGGGASISICSYYGTTDFFQMYSSSISNLYNIGSKNSTYASIIESRGENFENGGILRKYFCRTNSDAVNVWGTKILHSTASNASINYNGTIDEETTLKKGDNGTLYPIKTEKYHYEFEDTRASKNIAFYSLRVHNHNDYFVLTDTTCNTSECLPWAYKAASLYDVDKYIISSPWSYLKQKDEIMFDENGGNPMTIITKYFYDEVSHQQVTRTETEDSKGDITVSTNKYPINYAGNAIYDAMVSTNYINPVINNKVEKLISSGLIPISETNNNYKLWDGLNGYKYFDIANIEASVKGTLPFDVIGTITKRDAMGNVTEYTGKDGVINSVIWGYHYLYPVAKISGLDLSTLTSTLGASVEDLQNATTTELLTKLHDLRTNLTQHTSNYQMTGYTYVPFIGVNGMTDINEKRTTYEYDPFGRLRLVKDQDDFVVKNIQYNYAESSVEDIPKLYFNTEQSVNIRCVPCLKYGTIGTYETFTIPANTYISIISVADANSKAIADVTSIEQIHVNETGLCTNADNWCGGGPQFKKIGCNCEEGRKECLGNMTYSADDHGYYYQYHYRWSDNSVSSTFNGFTTDPNYCINLTQ